MLYCTLTEFNPQMDADERREGTFCVMNEWLCERYVPLVSVDTAMVLA